MEKERMIVDHEPEPGYRKALFLVTAVAVLYMTFIILRTTL